MRRISWISSPEYVVIAGEVVAIGPVLGPRVEPDQVREMSRPLEVAEVYEHRNLSTGKVGLLLTSANGKVTFICFSTAPPLPHRG